MDAGNGGRSRHAAQGAETSDRVWRVAGVNNFQVDVVPLREKMRGVCATERGATMMNGC